MKDLNKQIKQNWNQRFTENEWTYGTEPVPFFVNQLKNLNPGHILLPAEGEGRNALYAAQLGWEVVAFDLSEVGRQKALEEVLQTKHVIEYLISGVLEFDYARQFDALGLFYAHWPAPIRREAHKHLQDFLKPGGHLVLQAFSKKQLGNSSGGPRSIEMLFDLDELRQDFDKINWTVAQEVQLNLDEGPFHQGPAQILQMAGVKK